MSKKTPNKQHRHCRNCRDSSTHNKELAVDVLIDRPPAAGAEGFVENIRELGCRYSTKRYMQTRARPLLSMRKEAAQAFVVATRQLSAEERDKLRTIPD
jgi:hypothetical protein